MMYNQQVIAPGDHFVPLLMMIVSFYIITERNKILLYFIEELTSPRELTEEPMTPETAVSKI